MASHQAIAATAQAILNLLADACPRDEFPSAEFKLYKAENFQSPMDEGMSLYLYRIAVNGSRRNLPPLQHPSGRRFKPPLPLDLFFLLTPWARDPVQQYRLLGWAMRTLEDNPILPSGYLNRQAPEPNVFRPPEAVELFCESVTLQDLTNIWEMARHRHQPSVVYTARMLAIDSKLPIEEKDVQTRVFEMAKQAQP